MYMFTKVSFLNPAQGTDHMVSHVGSEYLAALRQHFGVDQFALQRMAMEDQMRDAALMMSYPEYELYRVWEVHSDDPFPFASNIYPGKFKTVEIFNTLHNTGVLNAWDSELSNLAYH